MEIAILNHCHPAENLKDYKRAFYICDAAASKPAGTTDVARGREPNAQGGPRRSKHHNPWGLDEAQALIEGVSRCGGGKWADIKKLGFPEIEHRTAG